MMKELKHERFMVKTYKGSSKNVTFLEDRKQVVFEFTNRYSIFDWGEMPDQLENKGVSLAVTGKVFFELLNKQNIKNHFISLCDSSGTPLKPNEVSSYMLVEAIDVHPPVKTVTGYNYDHYKNKPTDCLVPLEVIFRWGAPEGSSLLKRHPEMKKNERFNKPIIEFTTKLEAQDRSLTRVEAQEIAGLSSQEMGELIQLTTKVAIHLKEILEIMNLELWDGKLEWAFNGEKREFKLVDAIGLDELRVTYLGEILSKEFLRKAYRGSEWEKKLTEAKRKSLESGEDFKKICDVRPEKLTPAKKLAAQSLYLCFANDLSNVFSNHRPFGTSANLNHWLKEFV
ncbi:MAG: hypothetical protein K2P81_11165 [Bacteriovoracaceae bacterium]|nr:hypothetical protein [Bacteriovoracaceae bacterium]